MLVDMSTHLCVTEIIAMAALAKLNRFSKFLVYLCRHGARDWGLECDDDGWLQLAGVLNLHPAYNFTTAHVTRVVNELAGNRLELSGDGQAIRAVQGHSLAIRDDGYLRVTLDDDTPELLVHGTNDASWMVIQQQGLKPMARQHVHLAPDVNKVRARSTVHIYVSKTAVIHGGLELLIASNGVILCRDTIPPECFQTVWHVTQQRELLNVAENEWVVREEVESNTRWKQIRLGKWTYEYAVWAFSSDAEKVEFPIPEPPDSSNPDLSKRAFLRDLSAWRRGLHEFQAWYQAQHAEAGTEMPPVKRARGSISQEMPYFCAGPKASSSSSAPRPSRAP